MTREEAAERLLELLTDDPQTEAQLRRRVLGETTAKGSPGKDDSVRAGLGVLESRRKAKRIPGTTGSARGGWAIYNSRHEAVLANPLEVEFPYSWAFVKLDQMFIDESYQRPLTTFVDRIQRRFDPVLFQTLALNDRGTKNQPYRYAIIDGQTRWVAAKRLEIREVPCIVFKKLSPEEEAEIFSRLQKERKGMVSWHRFRADLRAMKPEALAIKAITDDVGYTLGDGAGQMKAVGALESTFRIDEYTLERTLTVTMDAWPDLVPEGPVIRGMHYFLRHYPIGQKRRDVINDERLVNRLKVSSPEALKRKASAIKEGSVSGKGSAEKFYGQAIQNIYQAGGRSK